MARPRATDIDRHISARIRERRIMLGFTQQELADLTGVGYQQVHKYERGINRVSAGRLLEIAQALSAPVDYFFQDLEKPVVDAPRERIRLEIAENLRDMRPEQLDQVASIVRSLATLQRAA